MICGPLTIAFASWVAPGTGTAASRAVSLTPGNAPTASVAGRTVSLSWSASAFSNGAMLSGYQISRYDSAGTVLQSVAAGSCAAIVFTTSCSETSVPAGTWKYAVTPAVGNWRGTRSGLVTATVSGPSLTLSPTSTTAPAALTGTIASFNPGPTLQFRIDNAATGTVLAGTVGGTATPTAIPAGVTSNVTVALPAATTPGAHTIYAVSSGGESASAAITVASSLVPAPTITAGPAQPSNQTSAAFSFTDSGSVASYTCALDGGSASPCSSPFSYTGLTSATHTFSVVAINAGGTSSAATTYSWLVDTVLPSGAVTFPTSGSSRNAATYTAGCATAGVADVCGTATDASSGVGSVWISVQAGAGGYWNGTSFVAGPEVLLSPTGTTTWSYGLATTALINATTYTVRVHVTDVAGNNSPTASSAFTYDTTAPAQPVISGGPASPTTTTTASFTVTEADATATLACTLDASTAACTSPVSYSGLATGNHTFSVVATDPAGNASTTASFSWVVDVTGPTGAVTFPVGGASYNLTTYNQGCSTGGGDICGTSADVGTSVALVQVSVQSGAGNYYNGATFGSASESLRTISGTNAAWTLALPTTAGLTNGITYTIRVHVTDAVGNTSTTLSTFVYDTNPPPVPVVSGGPSNPTASGSASFTLTDTESPVTFSCTLDGTTTACTSPVSYTSLTTGSHTFTAKAVDPAGNASAATAAVTWQVDVDAPTAVITFPAAGSAYNAARYTAGCTAGTDICGTSADVGTGVQTVQVSVQLGTGNYWDGSSGFNSATETGAAMMSVQNTGTWNLAFPGTRLVNGSTYVVRVHVLDKVNNASTTSVSSFTYDTTAPTIPVAVTTGNVAGGTVGKAEPGDTVTYTFSEPMDPTSILAGWDGTSTSVVVAFLNNAGAGGGDRLLVTDPSFNQIMGTFDLGSAAYVSGLVTFGQSGTASTMVMSGSTITITFGSVNTPASVGTVTTGGTTLWTLPGTLPSDRAGNAVTGTPPSKLTIAF